jgi:hypothetical protein
VLDVMVVMNDILFLDFSEHSKMQKMSIFTTSDNRVQETRAAQSTNIKKLPDYSWSPKQQHQINYTKLFSIHS